MKLYVKQVNFVVLLSVIILIVKVNSNIVPIEEKEPPCDFIDSVNITDGVMDKEGNMHFNGDVFNQNQFGTFDYIIDEEDQTKVSVPSHIRGCICLIKPCLRFCCPFNSFSNESNCEQYLEDELNYTHPVVLKDRTNLMVDIYEQFGIVYGLPCQQNQALDPELYEDDRFDLHINGNLQFRNGEHIDYKTTCFTHMYDENVDDFVLTVLKCYEEPRLMYPYGMLISVPFLFMTFLVYALIPELQNLHGKNLMCYVFCLFMAFILLSCINLFTNEIVEISNDLCSALGFSVYFAFVASFFWLNILSFDIFLTFRGVSGGIRKARKRKFILYSCYAWGCSIAILCWTLIADNTGILPEKYRPRIGQSSCWLEEDKTTEFLYLYLMVITLIIANVILFACTSYKIIKLQKETAKITKGDGRKFNQLESEKDRFGLYLRLFIVMGVSWCFEIISWAVENPNWFFYVTDFFNCFQGLFIFGLFVWKPKIRHLIVKRYRTYKGLPITTSSARSRTSSSIYSRQSSINSRMTTVFGNSTMDNVENTPMYETD